jgi:hypothetical protein
MRNCEECGKTLGIFEGYQHPTMGKKHNLCSKCFDNVNESVMKWKEFVLSNSFNINVEEENFKLKWESIKPMFKKRRNILQNVCAETGILIEKSK